MKIKSVFYHDSDCLKAVNRIYLDNSGFELDPTYSKGCFYKDFQEPKYKSDLFPQIEGIIKADCRKLNFKDLTIKSIIFDPPFLFRNQESNNNDKMCKRFSYFNSFLELKDMYRDSLKEFFRILSQNGILCFKCQDMTGGSGARPFYCSHYEIIKMATEIGFILKDIGIVISEKRIIRNAKEQGCFRKIHCYFLIFKKSKKHNYKDSGICLHKNTYFDGEFGIEICNNCGKEIKEDE